VAERHYDEAETLIQKMLELADEPQRAPLRRYLAEVRQAAGGAR